MDQIKKRIALVSLSSVIVCVFCLGYHFGSGESLFKISIQAELIIGITNFIMFIAAINIQEHDL